MVCRREICAHAPLILLHVRPLAVCVVLILKRYRLNHSLQGTRKFCAARFPAHVSWPLHSGWLVLCALLVLRSAHQYNRSGFCTFYNKLPLPAYNAHPINSWNTPNAYWSKSWALQRLTKVQTSKGVMSWCWKVSANIMKVWYSLYLMEKSSLKRIGNRYSGF